MISLDGETCNNITRLTLTEYRDYLQRELDQWNANPKSDDNPDGYWLHPEDVIHNIFLLRVTNFQEQKEAFNKLLSLLKKGIGLIVVDSMVMFYRLKISESTQEKARKINSSLVRQMRILNEIARKKNIPVLITDQVYGKYQSREDFEAGKEKEIEMIGGDIMKYWSKCIVELKNLGHGKKKAKLIKHRSLPEKEFLFNITDSGIKKL